MASSEWQVTCWQSNDGYNPIDWENYWRNLYNAFGGNIAGKIMQGVNETSLESVVEAQSSKKGVAYGLPGEAENRDTHTSSYYSFDFLPKNYEGKFELPLFLTMVGTLFASSVLAFLIGRLLWPKPMEVITRSASTPKGKLETCKSKVPDPWR